MAPTYSKDFVRNLADEIERLPVGAALERAIADCAILREQVRQCRRGIPKDVNVHED